jgi:hypothetical protein
MGKPRMMPMETATRPDLQKNALFPGSEGAGRAVEYSVHF